MCKHAWERHTSFKPGQKQVKAYKQPIHPQQSGLSAKITDSSDRVVRIQSLIHWIQVNLQMTRLNQLYRQQIKLSDAALTVGP